MENNNIEMVHHKAKTEKINKKALRKKVSFKNDIVEIPHLEQNTSYVSVSNPFNSIPDHKKDVSLNISPASNEDKQATEKYDSENNSKTKNREGKTTKRDKPLNDNFDNKSDNSNKKRKNRKSHNKAIK